MSYIQTASGRKFDLLECTVDDIHIEDIAHALANLCRFSGHIPTFYSVAQHCIEMSWVAPEEIAFEALMHDAAEAYLGDVTKHLKELIGGVYHTLEDRINELIALKWNLQYPLPPAVKRLDGDMLETEFKQIWRVRDPAIPSYGSPLPIILRPWPPGAACQTFLARFENLRR